jgi:uncharacterized protein
MSKTVSDDAPFGANSPFFLIVKEGLEGLVDGDDYFDPVAVFNAADWPEGRR